MKYQAIIFDMDGTISDSEQLWCKATEAFLSSNHIYLEDDEQNELHRLLQGISLTEATLYLKKRFELLSAVEKLSREYAQHAHVLIGNNVQFINGFLAFHSSLNAHQLKYGIATNADSTTLSAVKNALSLETLFGEHIYNIDHVDQQAKPKPDVYLYAAQQLNVSPYACIAVEDSACGIKSAKAANMFCIGINSHGDYKQLEEADMIIDSYEEIDLSKLLAKE